MWWGRVFCFLPPIASIQTLVTYVLHPERTLSTYIDFGSTDIANYQPAAYLATEFANQLLVGFLLSMALFLMKQQNNRNRYLTIFVLGLAGISATYLQQMNWWNVPSGYQLGMVLNVGISWALAVWISGTWIIKKQAADQTAKVGESH